MTAHHPAFIEQYCGMIHNPYRLIHVVPLQRRVSCGLPTTWPAVAFTPVKSPLGEIMARLEVKLCVG
jgi:hypothetical protein